MCSSDLTDGSTGATATVDFDAGMSLAALASGTSSDAKLSAGFHQAVGTGAELTYGGAINLHAAAGDAVNLSMGLFADDGGTVTADGVPYTWHAYLTSRSSVLAQRFTVVVDLPSLGMLEVTTKLWPPSISTNWRFVRSCRNSSDRTLSGIATGARGRPRRPRVSSEIVPSRGESTRARASCSLRIHGVVASGRAYGETPWVF